MKPMQRGLLLLPPAGALVLALPLPEPLEAVRVAEGLGGEVGHDLAELEIGGGEAGAVAEGAEEDRADGGAPPRDRNDGDGLDLPRRERPPRRAQRAGRWRRRR